MPKLNTPCNPPHKISGVNLYLINSQRFSSCKASGMNRPLRELSKGVRDEARRLEEDRGHDAVMNTECDRERTFPG